MPPSCFGQQYLKLITKKYKLWLSKINENGWEYRARFFMIYLIQIQKKDFLNSMGVGRYFILFYIFFTKIKKSI